MREDERQLQDHHHDPDQQQSSSGHAVPSEGPHLGHLLTDAAKPSHVQPSSPPQQRLRHGRRKQGQAHSPLRAVVGADSKEGVGHDWPDAMSSSTSSSNLEQKTTSGSGEEQNEGGAAVLDSVQHRRKRLKACEDIAVYGNTEFVPLTGASSGAQQYNTAGTEEHVASCTLQHLLQQPVEQEGLGAMPLQQKHHEVEGKERDEEQQQQQQQWQQQQQQQLAADNNQQIQLRQKQLERKRSLLLRGSHQRAQSKPLPQLQQTLGQVMAQFLPQAESTSSGGNAVYSGGQPSTSAGADTISPLDAIKVAAAIMAAAGQQPNLFHIAAVAARLLCRQQQVQELVNASTGRVAAAAFDPRKNLLQQSSRGGSSATASVKVFRRNLPSAAPLTFAGANGRLTPSGAATEHGVTGGTGGGSLEYDAAGTALTGAAAATVASAAGPAAATGHSASIKRSLSGSSAGTGSKSASAAAPSRSTTLIHRKHRTLCQVHGCGVDLTAKKGSRMWKYRCCARHMLVRELPPWII